MKRQRMIGGRKVFQYITRMEILPNFFHFFYKFPNGYGCSVIYNNMMNLHHWEVAPLRKNGEVFFERNDGDDLEEDEALYEALSAIEGIRPDSVIAFGVNQEIVDKILSVMMNFRTE